MIAIRIVTGLLLLAHGLVHLLYLAPDVPEFSLDRSRLVPEAARRPLGLGLIAATVAAFALVASAVWGVPGLTDAWPALLVVGGLLSATLLLCFWSARLAIGLTIDVVLVAVAVVRPDWAEQLV